METIRIHYCLHKHTSLSDESDNKYKHMYLLDCSIENYRYKNALTKVHNNIILQNVLQTFCTLYIQHT